MILVPIKDLLHAKQRLSHLLTPEQRTELAHSMVEDVFDALAPFATNPGVTAVSGDARASQHAKERNFAILVDDQQAGETAAIAMATTFVVELGATFTVVFPADIPLITSDEVREFLALKPERGCAIAPAYDKRGTNGILRAPGDLIPLKFGNDSYLPHLAAAKATGLEVIVREFPGIGLDVDNPHDVAALMQRPIRSRAQRLIEQWNIVGSVHA